jgi:hypothetical protein
VGYLLQPAGFLNFSIYSYKQKRKSTEAVEDTHYYHKSKTHQKLSFTYHGIIIIHAQPFKLQDKSGQIENLAGVAVMVHHYIRHPRSAWSNACKLSGFVAAILYRVCGINSEDF